MASLIGALPIPTQPLSLNSRISFSQSETLAIPLPSSYVSLSISTAAAAATTLPSVYCGRGDKKTERGKRFNHSFGNARPRNKDKGRGPARVPVPVAPPKVDKFEDDSVVKVDIDESLS